MLKILVRGETPDAELVRREANAADVSATVAEIIADVRANGDAALLKYNARFDRAEGVALEVTPEEMDAAYASVDPELVKVMQLAAENIRDFHKRQLSGGYVMSGKNGALLGQRVIPLRRVGLYIPGGTAAYPSSVLMNCIPAKIAGVDEIVMTTPASGGAVSPVILAAAKIAGVDRVFRVGGAQAVAALAYGTETVPQVDKIVGPGNAFVAEAKRQVFGQVAIDMIAGPSEILVVSDGKSDPKWMAADLLSQAEHDRLATAILITDSMALARGRAGRGRAPAGCPPARGDSPRGHRGKRQDNRHRHASPRRWRWPTPSRPSTWSWRWTSPSPGWAWSGTRAASSSAATAPSRWATTSPARTTPCPPWARPASPAPSAWRTSSSAPTSRYYTAEALESGGGRRGAVCRCRGPARPRRERDRPPERGRGRMSRYMNSRYAALDAYVPGEQPRGEFIKLNANESPYPPSPAVLAAVRGEEGSMLNMYPDAACRALDAALAEALGVASGEHRLRQRLGRHTQLLLHGLRRARGALSRR